MRAYRNFVRQLLAAVVASAQHPAMVHQIFQRAPPDSRAMHALRSHKSKHLVERAIHIVAARVVAPSGKLPLGAGQTKVRPKSKGLDATVAQRAKRWVLRRDLPFANRVLRKAELHVGVAQLEVHLGEGLGQRGARRRCVGSAKSPRVRRTRIGCTEGQGQKRFSLIQDYLASDGFALRLTTITRAWPTTRHAPSASLVHLAGLDAPKLR